eukprot:6913263-Prymnesium_polylepis.1
MAAARSQRHDGGGQNAGPGSDPVRRGFAHRAFPFEVATFPFGRTSARTSARPKGKVATRKLLPSLLGGICYLPFGEEVATFPFG